jgi:hypothetical protein
MDMKNIKKIVVFIYLFAGTLIYSEGAEQSKWPPPPNFKNKINYINWYQKRSNLEEMDNAANYYKLFFQTGKHDRPNYLAPSDQNVDKQIEFIISNTKEWEPNEYPILNKYLEELSPYIAAYERGSHCKYFSFHITDRPKNILEIRLPHTGNSAVISKAIIVKALLKNKEGKPSNYIDAINTVFRHTKHIEQGISMVEKHLAIKERNLLYDSIIVSVNRNVIDFCDISELKYNLFKNDSIDLREILIDGLSFSQACDYEILQDMCLPFPLLGGPRFNDKKVRYWHSYLFPNSSKNYQEDIYENIKHENPLQIAKYIRSCYDDNIRIIKSPFESNYKMLFAQLENIYKDKSPYFRFFFSSNLSGVYTYFMNVERNRRLAHLSIFLLDYHYNKKQFPEKTILNASQELRNVITDPLTGKPFEYVQGINDCKIVCEKIGDFESKIICLKPCNNPN